MLQYQVMFCQYTRYPDGRDAYQYNLKLQRNLSTTEGFISIRFTGALPIDHWHCDYHMNVMHGLADNVHSKSDEHICTFK